jgi:hypothetical protein
VLVAGKLDVELTLTKLTLDLSVGYNLFLRAASSLPSAYVEQALLYEPDASSYLKTVLLAKSG